MVMAGAPARPDRPQPDLLGPAAGVRRAHLALGSSLSRRSRLGAPPGETHGGDRGSCSRSGLGVGGDVTHPGRGT